MRIRHVLLIAAASLVCAAGAAGQDLSNKVQVVYSLDPAPHLTATNVYSSPITGMAITVDTATAPQRRYEIFWYDSGVAFTHNPPLDVGQSYSLPVGPVNLAPDLQPHIWAVAFQDGESFGDPHWLAELHARREAAYKEIGTVTKTLNDALAQHESNDEIVSTLNNMKASLRTSIADPEPRIAAMFVTEWAVGNLRRPPGLAAHWGSPEERVSLVILPFFARWREALQRYDPKVK
jgi:hypothetical protein